MKKTHALFMRSIVKQFFHTVLFQDEELVDAKLSTSDYCRRVSCHGMSHHIASHILLSRYMSHSHIILLSRYMYHIKTRNTTLLPQPPPPPKSAGLSLTANLFIVTPPPLGSNVHVYIFLRASLVGGNNFGLPFWVHSSPHIMLLVSQNYESFKYGIQNMKK